ncbi:MAG TPA: DUF308 domain-containing protein [Gemmatimonadaceae bacterium]|nr:DUF308 domain-containing protein [Gemmatimonadaceae bacterium]
MITDDIVAAYRHGKWALILRGLFGIALGVFILARPLASVAAFALVIAIWALFDGIVNIVHSFDLRSVASHWWVMLLSGIVSVGFGVAALYYYPTLSLAFAVVWTAWWLITAGGIAIYLAVQERRADVSWGWTLTFGLIALAAGVLAIMYPGVTLAWLMGMIAAFGIVGGIVMLVGAGKMQSFEHDVSRAMRTPSHA